VATNTLERVAPLTHAVGNVLKRIFVIGFSIVVFGKQEATSALILVIGFIYQAGKGKTGQICINLPIQVNCRASMQLM